MNALNVNFFLLPRKFLIFTTHCSTYLSAQPNLCSAPRARATRSSSVVTLSQPSRSVKITSRSFRYAMHHLISGINFLSHSASLVQNTLLLIIIMKEFIVRLLQCGHEHRSITLSIKLKSVVK